MLMGLASKDNWRKLMLLICTLPGVDRLTPVHQKIGMLHDMGSIAVSPRTPALTSVVIPSTRFIDHVDAQRSRSIDDIRDEIRPKRHLFKGMLGNPIQFALWTQSLLYDMTLKLPPKYSSKKLELRGKQSRRPNAWALEDKDKDEAAQDTKLQMVPCHSMR
jgi:hypothetical protein